MLDRQLIDKYAWVNEIEAWTVAVIERRTADEVIRIYGGDPADSVGDFTFSQLSDLQGDGGDRLKFHMQAFDSGDHVVAWENNGWGGSHPEIARRCSDAGGSFFSVYWNVNAFGLLTQAIDGKITARFESLYPFDPDPPQPADVRPEWAVGPEVDVELAWQVCLALLEQRTGLTVEPTWLGQQRPTYPIPEPHWLVRDLDGADAAR